MNVSRTQFETWEKTIHPDTWSCQPGMLAWAAGAAALEDPGTHLESRDPIIRRGAELRDQLIRRFANRSTDPASALRVLVHEPNYTKNPAGFSLFRNLAMGFAGIGVPSELWPEGLPLAPYLNGFRPTLILSVDHRWYAATRTVTTEDIDTLRDYKKRHDLTLGLASNHFDREKLPDQLREARRLGVSFFYSSHSPGYVRQRYMELENAGFPVASCEFGANPFLFYPVAAPVRDLNFVFLGSANGEKWGRYIEFFDPVLRDLPGLIVGVGWPQATAVRINDGEIRHLYARARVGINLHVPSQIVEPTELNERAYNLAACGIPQVTDWPGILTRRFSEHSVYAARTPLEYAAQLRRALANPAEARERAALALEEVMSHHTVLHRASGFVEFIKETVRNR